MQGILQKIHKGELNDQAKEAVVKGILPLEPSELVTAIFHLCKDNSDLVEPARDTVADLSEEVLVHYFEDRNLQGEILNFYLVNFTIPIKAKGAALLNQHLLADTLNAIAIDLEESLLDLAVNNQVKILEEPDIIDGLLANEKISINQIQKLKEYKRLLLRDIISSEEDLEGKTLEEVEKEAIQDAREYVDVFGKESGKDVPKSKTEEESTEEEIDARKMTTLEKVQRMSVPQKVQGAIKGDRELRNILVRDSNKLVASAVIKSPRITDAEIEFYANLRNVHTEVLRLIASNREWLKNYKVIHNLVKNPRVPLTYTVRLLSRLHKKDMRLLIRDRGVPEALRTMARKISQEQERRKR